VIYKISCKNCDISYVGQTKRQLKTRLHVSDINKKSKSPSMISNQRIEENHNFKWNKNHNFKWICWILSLHIIKD